MSSEDNEYILFFSKNCTYCTELLNKLYKNDDILKQIVLINVNNNNLKIPAFVKSVPSLIVNEDNNQHLLVGSDIFNWIDEIIKNKKEEIMNWDPITMSGYSDDFSFLDEKETVNLDRSYCYISNTNDFKINTPTDDSMKGSSNGKSQSDGALEKLLAMRKANTPQSVARQ